MARKTPKRTTRTVDGVQLVSNPLRATAHRADVEAERKAAPLADIFVQQALREAGLMDTLGRWTPPKSYPFLVWKRRLEAARRDVRQALAEATPGARCPLLDALPQLFGIEVPLPSWSPKARKGWLSLRRRLRRLDDIADLHTATGTMRRVGRGGPKRPVDDMLLVLFSRLREAVPPWECSSHESEFAYLLRALSDAGCLPPGESIESIRQAVVHRYTPPKKTRSSKKHHSR